MFLIKSVFVGQKKSFVLSITHMYYHEFDDVYSNNCTVVRYKNTCNHTASILHDSVLLFTIKEAFDKKRKTQHCLIMTWMFQIRIEIR